MAYSKPTTMDKLLADGFQKDRILNLGLTEAYQDPLRALYLTVGTEEFETTMQTWLQENVRGRWSRRGLLLAFEEERDAIAFKLWWM